MFDFNGLLNFVREQYLAYGYIIVTVAAFLEYLVVVGYFWPGGTIIVLGVTYSISGELSFPLLLALVWLGAGLGNVANYWLGRAGVLRLIETSRFYPKFEPYLKRTAHFMARYGRGSVLLSQFVGYIRPFVAVLAGTVRMPPGRFFLTQLPGLLLWNFIFCGLAYLLAKTLNVETFIGGLGLVVVVIVIVSWAGYRRFLAGKIIEAKDLE